MNNLFLDPPNSASMIRTFSLNFMNIELITEDIKRENDFNILKLSNCPSMQNGIDLILLDEFIQAFYECPEAIGIAITFNEEFKLLDDLQLEAIEDKYSNPKKSILISFQSTIDHKFFMRWRGEGKNKMLTLEVTEAYHEYLKEVEEFTRNFILKSLENRESGNLNN